MKLFNHGVAKAQNKKGYIYTRCSTKEQLASRPRAIGYVRSATPELGQTNSVEVQAGKIIKYCRENNMELNCIFVDAGKAGTDANRQGLVSLVEAVERKIAQCVLVSDSSRIARDLLLFQYIKRDIENNGAKLIFTDSPLGETDPAAALMDQMLACMNSLYPIRPKQKQKTNKIREMNCPDDK